MADIMNAVSLEPGISVATEQMTVSVRGGGNDQVSFQVDGMERKDKLNSKVYVPTRLGSGFRGSGTVRWI